MRRLPPPPVLIFLFLLLFGAGFVLLFPEKIADSLRPWLERVAADRLDARVRIGRIVPQSLLGGKIVVSHLRIEREGEWRLAVPHLEAEFTLSGLLARRLHAVILHKPSLTIAASGGSTPTRLPEEPPLRIDRLSIAAGHLHLNAGGRTWRATAIDLAATLEPLAPFRLSARLGEGRGIPLRAAGELAWRETALTLRELRWEERELLSSPLTVTLLPTAGAAAEGSLWLARFDDEQLASLFAAFGQATPLPAGWRFSVADLRIRFRLADSLLHLAGEWPRAELAGGDGIRFPVAQGKMEISGWGNAWQYGGACRLAGAETEVQGRFAAGVWSGALHLLTPDPAGFIQQLTGSDLPPLASGIELAADYSVDAEKGSLRGALSGRPGAAPPSSLIDLAPLSADFDLQSEAAGLSGSGRLRLDGREIARLHGTGKRLHLDLLPLSGGELLFLLPPAARPDFLAGAQDVAGTAELVRDGPGNWRAQVKVRAAALALPKGELRQLAVSGRLHPRKPGVAIEQGRLAAQLAGEDWPKGEIAARFAGQLAADRYRLQLEELSLTGLNYASADGLSGFTAGHLQGRGTLAGRPGASAVDFDLEADLGVGEVLKDAFYADLRGLPAALHLHGGFDPAAGTLVFEQIAVDLTGLAAAAGSGTFGRKAASWHASVSLPALETVLTGGFGAGLAGIYPKIADLQLSGAVTADLAGALAGGSWHLQGEVRPQALAIAWPALRLQAQGGSGRIPLAFAGGSLSSRAGEPPPAHGEIAFSRLQLGPAVLAQQPIDLLATPNRFAVAAPLRFELAGGVVQLAEVAADFAADAPRFAARLQLAGIDLQVLTRELELPAMDGDLSADLGRIRYTAGTLTADGLLQIGAFGGAIQVRNLRLEALFSGYPNYYADVDFSGIDLSRLTRTFSFGEINGVADGYLHDLRLLGTTPAAFEARFETREKGRRSISVKALRNISVLSEGGFSAVLSRGIYRFIDFYRYRRIGIACSLHNDLFTLKGTARPGSDQYLVYGGWLPPKIDIIAPVHTISFKEMVKRLQRLDRTERPAKGGN